MSMIHRRNQLLLQGKLIQMLREGPVELQLPTREYGPHPEPERYPTRYVMNYGQWAPEEHEAHCA